MGRKSKPRSKSSRSEKGGSKRRFEASRLEAWLVDRLKLVRVLAPALLVAAAVGGVVTGLERLRDHVYARPDFQGEFELVIVPPREILAEQARYETAAHTGKPKPAWWVTDQGWDALILRQIKVGEAVSWTDEDLCERVADLLSESGWVSAVRGVRKRIVDREPDAETGERAPARFIEIEADFRRPVAMVLSGDAYYAVDRMGYRLPGEYTGVRESGWIRLMGIRSPLPDVGERFAGEDALAAAELGALLNAQTPQFRSRIDAVDVSNYGGRDNIWHSHITVWPVVADGADPRTRAFGWGSPLGKEIEENSVEDKLKLLYQHVRSQPDRPADGSIYPNALIELLDIPGRSDVRLAARNR